MEQVIQNSSGGETIGYCNQESMHTRTEQILCNIKIEGSNESNFKAVDWGYLQREYTASDLDSNGSTYGLSEEGYVRIPNEYILTEAEESGRESPVLVPPAKRQKREAFIESDSD